MKSSRDALPSAGRLFFFAKKAAQTIKKINQEVRTPRMEMYGELKRTEQRHNEADRRDVRCVAAVSKISVLATLL